MALITDKPNDIPSGNDLDKHRVAQEGPTEMRLGQNVLLTLDNPPDLQETRDIVVRLRCTAKGTEQRKVDGDETEFRRNTIVTAWELGTPKPPTAEDNQPGLYDHGDNEDQDDTGTEDDE